MKKLSEITDEIMLTIDIDDLEVMSKKDYMDSSYFLDRRDGENAKVSIAEKTHEETNFYGMLENLSEEHHESWLEDVWNELSAVLDTKKINEEVARVFKNNPTYYAGEEVEIDIKEGSGD